MRDRFQIIDTVKLFLLLGVVSIHCNLLTFSADYLPSFGADIVIFLSVTLTRICVPAFFIISGYLFFLNQEGFSFAGYGGKLYRRLYTLFIPYILWNLISLFLEIIKIRYLGFQDTGLFYNGDICWIKIFEGFFDYADGYPFAFAFWFIRNLMVFVVLSPIAYFLSNKKLFIGLLFILGCCVANTTLWGFSFFVIGGIMARYFKNYFLRIKFLPSLFCGIFWIVAAVMNLRMNFGYFYATILMIESVAALIFISYIVGYLRKKKAEYLIMRLVPAMFFIYAFHQLFCSVIDKFYGEAFGLDSSFGIIGAYCAAFISMVGISYLVWMVLKRICPSILNVLCGSR